ncbi:RnaseH-domain-containing protein [Mycena leptocephala]|nr:RnaseH-domain-containing protein [Mycena leptocephala]
MKQRLQNMEDRGWIGVTNHRRDRAVTDAKEGAILLAETGCNKRTPSELNLDVTPALQLKGAKLAKLTQAVAYAGIRELKSAVQRKASDNNVKQVISAILREFHRSPTAAQDFSRQVKNFLWKSLHSARRIGVFWKHIPECEERGICQFCNETEDLEHITLKCRRPGQSLIWSLAKDLWLRKYPTRPELSMGHNLPGTARLYRILITESLFTIWKVRNDSVISRAEDPLPENHIHNKWLSAINLRLHFDCVLTNHAKYGKQNSIKSLVVLQTWKSTLMNEELPEDWTKTPRF